MTALERLANLGITLPQAPSALGSYVPAVRTGNLVFISGQLPLADGKVAAVGHVGDDLDLAEAQEAARTSTINALGAVGGLVPLDAVVRVVRATVYVSAVPDFDQHPEVANGASELLAQVFGGAAGQHARSAVGVSSLPLAAAVEVELVLEVADDTLGAKTV